MAETSNNPFTRGTVLLLVIVGSIAFLALLYGLSNGDFNQRDNDGKAHAISDSLVGYSAFAEMLRKTGNDVRLGRSEADYDKENLLILTPPRAGKASALRDVIEKRSFVGPTLVILPKWIAISDDKLRPGWSRLTGVLPFRSENPKQILEDAIENDPQEDLEIRTVIKDGANMFSPSKKIPEKGAVLSSAFGQAGRAPPYLATLKGKNLRAVIRDPKSGKMIAGYRDDGGFYEYLDGLNERSYGDDVNYDRYPTIFVADPNLFNNMGMADKETALHALALIDALDEGFGFPIVFDVDLNGLGSAENLLTLAFRPPFLAATLCFLIAAVIIGWQTFTRFAPPMSGVRSISFGKTALVSNSAAMLKLMSRQHLLRDPYLNNLRYKAANGLGLSPTMPEQELTALFDKASRSDKPPFSVLEAAFKRAKKPQDIADAAVQLDIWKKETL